MGNDIQGDEQPTPRQVEILHLVARGKSNKEIGRALGVSQQTIKNHLSDLYRRLGSSDRAHAVYLAIQRGYIEVKPYAARGTATV